MALWWWFLIAAASGALVGVEAWAWMRHGISVVVLAGTGLAGLIGVILVVGFVGSIAYGVVSAVSGWDPLGWQQDSAQSAPGCDSNYEGACLKPDAYDYDCAGGSGDGPLFTGTVRVVGSDVYGLDSNGNGIGCE